MTKKYQRTECDTSALAVPEQVSVAMGEIAADMREGLLALAVGAGLQVMQQLMEADVTAACGPRGKHDPDRTATRHGTGAGSVTLGGRRVPVTRPRVRAADGSGEVPVPAYELFTSTELLGRMAMERMLAGVSTRRYPIALEPVGEQVEADGTSTSKSAVSRKFVALTETALTDLLAGDLYGLDLVAIMIDGVHFADHLCVVALGIGIDGHLASPRRGGGRYREHHRGPRSAGGAAGPRPGRHQADPGRPRRRQGLAAAVKEVFDHPVIGRCQLHKIRNVEDHLPDRLRGPVSKRMRAAYHADSALEAEALLEALAKELDKTHPGAAASLREGMAETLTVLRLGVPPTLARTLRSTNAVESMISICRDHSRNVKRWRDARMALRWCAAGLVEAAKQFRRVNGHLHLHLPALRTSLQRHVRAANVGTDCHTQDVSAA